jgi:UDP-2,3-diacylglucosamine hydrolase
MPEQATDCFAELRAPAHWRAVDFFSDLHLQASDPLTFEAWRRYLQRPTDQRADALFILGDLFEVWVGDDALLPQADDAHHPERQFQRDCVALLREHSRHTPTFFMAGNRDFLLGPAALMAAGMVGLSDPTVLVFRQQAWLLSHGDALCLEDVDYMLFRAEVRSPKWQQDFLSQPLCKREALARDLRARSEARKVLQRGDASLWADVDAEAAKRWLLRAGAHTLIHGHTHRPARHSLGERDGVPLERVVLSDWDLGAKPPRADVLQLNAQGLNRIAWATM